jgi:hypothetical protein
MNSEPVAGCSTIPAVEKFAVAINEELASLMIPCSRTSRSIRRYKAHRGAPPAEIPTVTFAGKAVYAGSVRRSAASTDAKCGPVRLSVEAEDAALASDAR